MSQPIPVYAVHPVTLWAPLALGLMAACIEQELAGEYSMVYPFALNSQELIEQVAANGPGVVMFSNYMWTREANLEISAAIKRYSPSSVLIHGGPDTPTYEGACESYLKRYPFIDYAVHSEGEQTLIHLLRTLAANEDPQGVEGLGFLRGDSLIKTPPRVRSLDPNLFPSPFMHGVFDKLRWQTWNAMPLETNRGCPYGCVFCDWGSATMQKMRLFSLERIRAEIEWTARHQIPKLWVADSNFGIFERDLEITRTICEIKEKYGYPKLLITNYAKNTKQHLIDIIEMLVEHGLVSTGIVSLQTRDQTTLAAVNRSNIKTTEYDRLRATFESRHLPMSTQLMIGLPGSTRASFKDDLRFFFNQLIDVQIFRTVVLPNSPMAAPEFVKAHGLVYEESGMLLSTNLLDAGELRHIEQLGRLFRCAHTYGMFRYWLNFLQWDYGIDPIEVLDKLVEASTSSQEPWIARLWDAEALPQDLLTTHAGLREQLRAQAAWGEFWQTLGRWTLENYPQVRDDSALATVLQVQVAVMPAAGASYPLEQPLTHDFVAYHQAHGQDQAAPLASYGPATLSVSDPLRIGETPLAEVLARRNRPAVIWELYSALSPKNTEADLFLVQALKTQAKASGSELPAA